MTEDEARERVEALTLLMRAHAWQIASDIAPDAVRSMQTDDDFLWLFEVFQSGIECGIAAAWQTLLNDGLITL